MHSLFHDFFVVCSWSQWTTNLKWTRYRKPNFCSTL